MRFGPHVMALGALLVARGSLGAPTKEVGLAFDAPLGCPTRPAFVQEVAVRTTRIAFTDGEDARVLVRREGAGFVGWLSTSPSDDGREMRSADCEALVRAFAVILAVAYDVAAGRDATPPSPTHDAVGPGEGSAAPPPDVPRPRPPSGGLPGPRRTTSWRFGGGIHAEALVLGGPMAAARIFAQASMDSVRALALALRVSASRSLPARTGSSDGSGLVLSTWSDVELELCGLKSPGAMLVVRACGTGAVTLLEVTPRERPNARDDARVGSTFGVSLPLTWYPIDSVSVELRPAMAVASRRYTFYFDPDATVYTTPALLLRLGIGAAVRF